MSIKKEELNLMIMEMKQLEILADRRIGPESITKREVSALLSLNKAALGPNAVSAEPNDAGDGQRYLLLMDLEIKARIGIKLRRPCL